MNAREEWLQHRRAGLGGSDIGAILGLSKYRTPVDVWMEKTGRIPGQDETLQMRFGSYAEDFVAQEYSVKTGRAVQRFKTMLHHPTAPILGNVDRLVIPEGQKRAAHQREIRTDRGLECKTASAFATLDDHEWGREGTDQVPASYIVQCTTYMALTKCQLWDLAVLFGNQEVRIYNLKRDAELEEEIVARSEEWWLRHVIADVAPEPICDADIKTLYPRDKGTVIEATADDLELIAQANELKAQISALESQLDGDRYAGTLGVMGSLKARIGDNSRLVFGGSDLVTWKASKDSIKTDWQAAFMELAGGSLNESASSIVSRHTNPVAGARRFLFSKEK